MSGFGSLDRQFGFAGVGFAALLALVALLLLPRGERRFARGSFVLLLVHLVFVLSERTIPHGRFMGRLFVFLALFALFASIARSAFLLAVRSVVARRLTRPWPRIVHDLLQGIVYFVVALIALSGVGVEPGSLLTTSALLTAVIGLSLQDTLGNLFAGLALQAQPPFSIGDWIRYAEGPTGIGRVIEINWRATHIVTVTEVEIIVPNAVMAKSPLQNFSRPTRITRCDTHVILPAELSPEIVRALCLRALENLKDVKREPAPSVTIGEFGERGVDYAVRYFIDDYAQRDLIESDVRQRLWYALQREEIGVPAPRRRIEPVVTATAEERRREATESAVGKLAQVEFLAGAKREVLERLAAGTRVALYAPSESIVRQGDPGDELFVIQRGSVEVLVTSSSNVVVPVARLESGATFGEAALLNGTQRTATVIAATECEVLVISGKAFRSAVELDPALESRLAERLAVRMAELNKAVAPSDETGDLDDDRRSDLLIMRIREFFRR